MATEQIFQYIVKNSATGEVYKNAGVVALFKGRQTAKPTRDALNKEAGKSAPWVVSRGWVN